MSSQTTGGTCFVLSSALFTGSRRIREHLIASETLSVFRFFFAQVQTSNTIPSLAILGLLLCFSPLSAPGASCASFFTMLRNMLDGDGQDQYDAGGWCFPKPIPPVQRNGEWVVSISPRAWQPSPAPFPAPVATAAPLTLADLLRRLVTLSVPRGVEEPRRARCARSGETAHGVDIGCPSRSSPRRDARRREWQGP